MESREKLLSEAGFTDAEFMMMNPPINEESGYKGHIEHGNRYGAKALSFAITKDAKNPELVMKWVDYFWASPEGNKLNLMGIEGITWETAPDGTTRYTQEAMNFESGRLGKLRDIGAYCGFPGLDTGLPPHTYRAEAEATAASPRQMEAMDRLMPLIVRKFSTGMPTDNESERVASIAKDLNTYRDEMITKFIVGDVSLDQWDEYIATMERLGVNELIEIYQQQYERIKIE
jgi:putative aldouronate transport system substrate-binding protein